MENSEKLAASETATTENNLQENQVLEGDANAPQEEKKQQEGQSESVPVSALISMRKKKQEAELRAIQAEERARLLEQGFEKRNTNISEAEENSDDDEVMTVSDYKKREAQTIKRVVRETEEKSWIQSNKEKAEVVNEKLEEFLKIKPHFANTLEQSTNRYEDAWHILRSFYDLNPSKGNFHSQSVSAEIVAPSSPAGTPKSAGIDQGLDLMKMSDKEYDAWVDTKKRRR